jgi:hypothetical protein
MVRREKRRQTKKGGRNERGERDEERVRERGKQSREEGGRRGDHT